MNRHTVEMLTRLHDAGISTDDALALRRISMTLHRWHELECGDGNDHASWTIARGKKLNNVDFNHDENGAPYLEWHAHNEQCARYTRIPDRENGAKKRLAAIMKRYPTLQAYIQGDPRGAALYILRPADVHNGDSVESCYSRGIAVYK